MSDETKAIALKWNRIFEGNSALADEIVAAGCVFHDGPPGIPSGPEGVKQWGGMFASAFPDMRVTDEDYIAEGDTVFGRFIARGTHQGELMGIAPTGKQVSISGINIFRIAGGKIVEHWVNYDAMGLMQQIGAIPAKD